MIEINTETTSQQINIEELTEKFVDGLRENKTWSYWNMFSIMQNSNPDFLEYIIRDYKKDPEDFFRVFHKSLRQVDFFENCAVIEPRISKSEMELRSKALRYCMKHRRDENGHPYEDYDKKDPTYVKYQELIPKLNTKLRTYNIKEDICGHLDSVLYSLISEDNQGLLYQYMDKFFKKELKNDK